MPVKQLSTTLQKHTGQSKSEETVQHTWKRLRSTRCGRQALSPQEFQSLQNGTFKEWCEAQKSLPGRHEQEAQVASELTAFCWTDWRFDFFSCFFLLFIHCLTITQLPEQTKTQNDT